MKASHKWFANGFMIIFVILLAVTPLIFVKQATFGGADGEAESLILEIAPQYEPWYKPFFEPASGEVESLVFSLQAALGAGIIGYGMGYYKGIKSTGDKPLC